MMNFNCICIIITYIYIYKMLKKVIVNIIFIFGMVEKTKMYSEQNWPNKILFAKETI